MTRSTSRRANGSAVAAGPRSVRSAAFAGLGVVRASRRRKPKPTHRPLAGAVLAATAGLLLAGCSVGQIAETARKRPSVPGANAEAQLRDSTGQIIGSVAVRDVLVAYQDPAGYARVGDAPVQARIFNDTTRPVRVTVTVAPSVGQESGHVIDARSVVLVGSDGAGASPDTPGTPGAQSVDDTPSGMPEQGEPTRESPSAAAGDTAPDQSASPSRPALPGQTAEPVMPSPDPTMASPGAAAVVEIPSGGFVALTPTDGRYLMLTGLRDRLAPGMAVPLRFRFSNGLELTVTAPMANPLAPPRRATPDSAEMPDEH